jgi:hypothetical protein
VWSDELADDFDAFLDHTVPLLNTISGLNNWGNWGMVFVLSAAAYQRDELATTAHVLVERGCPDAHGLGHTLHCQ